MELGQKNITVGDREVKSVDGYWKSFKISSLFGLLFGVVIVVLFSIKGEDIPISFIIVIPLFSGLLSGLGGIVGGILDSLLFNIGVKNPLLRRIISFSTIMLMSSVIAILVFWRGSKATFFAEVRGTMIWGILAGGIFGAIITGAEYYHWRMKKKLLVLELENKYLEELASKDTMLKEATKNILISRERNRMARELHDSISQGIHGIIYSISTLRQQLKSLGIADDKLNQVIDHLEETAESTMEELRSMIKELKPALLEKNNLIQAITNHCELFASRQQLELILDIEEINNLSPEQEIGIFRIIQEALANVQKHSTADQVKISMGEDKRSGGRVSLVIADNGQGFNPRVVKRGNGLNNITQRSREIGGELFIDSDSGQGTTIKVSIARD